MLSALLVDDPQLGLEVGIPERRAHQEAVELSLRQREGALLLDRVVRRDEEERLGQRPGASVHAHLTLSHRLEQRRLGLRHRPVDLVDEHDVGEHRARPELEVARPLVVDGEAGDVARLQVGRALDAREGSVLDAARDRACEDGLAGSGHVLEQDVSAAGERGQDELQLLALAAQDGLDPGSQPPRDLDGLGRHLPVHALHAPTSLPSGSRTRPPGGATYRRTRRTLSG